MQYIKDFIIEVNQDSKNEQKEESTPYMYTQEGIDYNKVDMNIEVLTGNVIAPKSNTPTKDTDSSKTKSRTGKHRKPRDMRSEDNENGSNYNSKVVATFGRQPTTPNGSQSPYGYNDP